MITQRVEKNAADQYLTALVARDKTPSVQYIFFNASEILYTYISGWADIIGEIKASDKTSYFGFSLTKTFTALAVLQLAEKVKLDLNDLASHYLPAFPYRSPITIRQLLDHTSGIPNPNPLNWIHLPSERSSFDRDEFFNAHIFKKYSSIRSRPNEKFYYSNLGYVLLGQIIETVSAMKYEQYVRKHIFEPLHLAHEALRFDISHNEHLAKGYQKRWSLLNLALGFFIDKSKVMHQVEGKWISFKKQYVNGASYGGIIGTPNAFVKYVQSLLKKDSPLLSEKSKQQLFHESITASGQATGMTLSWFKGVCTVGKYLCHAGGGAGYYCEMRLYPEQNLGSVIMFNRTGIRDERMLDKIDRLVYGSV